MIRQTSVHPDARFRNIVKAVSSDTHIVCCHVLTSSKRQEELSGTFIRENNISINAHPMRIKATLLTAPQIAFDKAQAAAVSANMSLTAFSDFR